MKIKTSELTGAALDWAVWACVKPDDAFLQQRRKCRPYSTDWAHGGPIIERECMDLQYQGGDTDVWAADIFDADSMVYGDTPLIAAMRCYVTSKLGNEVEVPDELKGE